MLLSGEPRLLPNGRLPPILLGPPEPFPRSLLLWPLARGSDKLCSLSTMAAISVANLGKILIGAGVSLDNMRLCRVRHQFLAHLFTGFVIWDKYLYLSKAQISFSGKGHRTRCLEGPGKFYNIVTNCRWNKEESFSVPHPVCFSFPPFLLSCFSLFHFLSCAKILSNRLF